MIEALALAAVVAAGIYLLVLGGASLLVPSRAGRFLTGFAASRSRHLLEMALRLVVGGSLVLQAPRMSFSGGFSLFGWVLLVTTACLLLMPWQWHRRFAQRVVPQAMLHPRWVGGISLVLGGLVLAAVIRGHTA